MSFAKKVDEVKRQLQDKFLDMVVDKLLEKPLTFEVNQTFNVTIGGKKAVVHIRGTVKVHPT